MKGLVGVGLGDIISNRVFKDWFPILMSFTNYVQSSDLSDKKTVELLTEFVIN